MIPVVYVFLEALMLFTLYQSGKSLRRDYRIFSKAGISAMAVYTFVIGLRFGRGIDYNVYWISYDEISRGMTYEKSLLFQKICELFAFFDYPYQIVVVLISFTFVLSFLLLFKNYRKIVPYALPLFALFSQSYVENMVRWYFAYSFFLIGLSYLLKRGALNIFFFAFSIIACLIHYAFLPVVIVFYAISIIRKPILPPYISIVVFLFIYFLFNVRFMENFVAIVQSFTFVIDTAYENYANRADYWLTGGFLGLEKSGRIGFSLLVLLILMTYFGYESVKLRQKQYIYAYNIFLIGLFIYPISLKIELVERYDMTFFFFRAIVLSSILISPSKLFHKWFFYVKVTLFILLVWAHSYMFISPFINSNKYYMFIWDSGHQSPDSMIKAWEDLAREINKK